jgi:hydrogenase maturation protease
MPVKVIFVGNPICGDDGIGPYLYEKLKNYPELKNYDIMELGVIGVDLLSYVNDGDQLIIVDALEAKDNFGDVIVINEDKLLKKINIISQHDFGMEQTITLLREYKPKITQINLLGIKVKNVSDFTDKLSDELLDNITKIKKEVIINIQKLVK